MLITDLSLVNKGILLFLFEIGILCWMKFYTLSPTAAWVSTALLVPISIIFMAFAALFYMKLVSHKSEICDSLIKELETFKENLAEGQKRRTDGSSFVSQYSQTTITTSLHSLQTVWYKIYNQYFPFQLYEAPNKKYLMLLMCLSGHNKKCAKRTLKVKRALWTQRNICNTLSEIISNINE